MRKFIYAKMALTNIKNNSKIYFPYILTCIGTVAVFYIMYALSEDPGLNEMSGGQHLAVLLSAAMVILGFFGAIFLFYTNSFLIKRRKREFGIYNILGMEKKHISKMMLWETIFTALIGLFLGLLAGIIFSKLAYLLLLAIMNAGSVYQTEVTLRFDFSAKAAVITLILFAAIFFLNLLNTLRQIHEHLHPPQMARQEPAKKPPLETWQKAFENGEYLRAAEMTEEQSYSFIDGRLNNLPSKKEKEGKRPSVLKRLHEKQAAIAARSGKTAPQMGLEQETERNRK